MPIGLHGCAKWIKAHAHKLKSLFDWAEGLQTGHETVLCGPSVSETTLADPRVVDMGGHSADLFLIISDSEVVDVVQHLVSGQSAGLQCSHACLC